MWASEGIEHTRRRGIQEALRDFDHQPLLLDNAIKFTLPGGRIAISAEPKGEEVLISLADTGPGIPKDRQARIFEKFEQVRGPRAGRPVGVGLGLAFCKLAVEAHGGRIWVEIEKGKGSCFSFTLPVWREK